MPLYAFILILGGLLALALLAFFLTGLYRLKEGESIIFVALGGKRVFLVDRPGWHYRLPVLYSPWKRLQDKKIEISYAPYEGDPFTIVMEVSDPEAYYRGRYEMEPLLEEIGKRGVAAPLLEKLSKFGLMPAE